MRLALAFLVLAGPASAGLVDPEALNRLPAADVIILGEVHDNALHHAHQARAVAALRPAALVFEMLTPEQVAGAAGVPRGDAAALAVALDWAGSGWPDFALYHPIIAAAPEAVLTAGGLPRAVVREAISLGAAQVFGSEAPRYGLDRPLDPRDQAGREAAQQRAHCDALPVDLLAGFVEAQRLRDAALARAAIEAHGATGGPVVVIAGTGHARRDEGVPALLAVAAPGLRVLSVGQMEEDPGAGAPFDLWLVTDPAPRGDPCAAFRN